MTLCRLIGLLIVFATWLLPASAQAAKARKSAPPASSAYQNKPIVEGAVVWYCAYIGQTNVSCRLGDAGTAAATRTRQAVDSRLPPLVHEIINNPEVLADEAILIPLHSDPFDFDLVGQLAESVMCGSQQLCNVIFAETRQVLSQLVSAFETTRQLQVAGRVQSFQLASAGQ